MAVTRWTIVMAGFTLLLVCAGRRPPLPDRTVEEGARAGATQFGAGEFSAALRTYRKALGEARRFDLPELQARYRFNIGRIYYECALLDSALCCFRESEALFAAEGSAGDAAVAGIFSALTIAYTGRTDSASALLKTAALWVGRDDRATLATAQTIMGLLLLDYRAAERSADRAFEVLRRQRDAHGCGVIFYYRAMSSFMRRQYAETRRYLDSSLSCYRQSPARYRTWKTLLGRAIVEYCAGRIDEGDHYYRRAAAAAPDMVGFPAQAMVRSCPPVWKP
ncbi:MAG: hypothetical protein JXA18_14475 [Chitinispirillaceae bacterium]|nr:hypothetical protein [Chitinispirillaceae bacterium]